MKILFISIFFIVNVFAQTYEFLETRYSDAIERSIELKGEINFTKDGLGIYYAKGDKLLIYINGTLTYSENDELKELDSTTVIRITQYFEILILLHNGDEASMEENFVIKNKPPLIELKPKGDLEAYLKVIELTKIENFLKKIHLVLKNDDIITISIGNAIQ